ncbi:hypothetical protein [Paenibacillus chibensis]|uniref:hypothetical protein n=1 Tax=Paenibacillus chibensis TaxID=59846 RepID=UPI000FD8D443|nr:hypothetical protein [Paenibacillus chibensis]MEC0370042.1 hypothetical protein [Paenibacillus chibensis]
MANVKIEVLDAVVDGQGKGAVLDVEAKTAQHLANIGYVRILDEVKSEEPDEKPAKSKRGSNAK